MTREDMKPKSITFESMNAFIENKQVDQKREQTAKKKVIFSGQSDNTFRIRLCCIENLGQIFRQALNNACDNGETRPHYITLRKDLMNGEGRFDFLLMERCLDIVP